METGSHGSVVGPGRRSLLSSSPGAQARKRNRETVVMNEVPEQAGREEEAEVRTDVH